MLTGSETVAITLGASAITGAGTTGVAVFTARSNRRRDLEARKLEAAAEFQRKLLGAFDAVQYAIQDRTDRRARSNAKWLLGEIQPTIGSLSLLFSSRSRAFTEAEKARIVLEQALRALNGGDLSSSKRHLSSSKRHRISFEDEVRRVVGESRDARWKSWISTIRGIDEAPRVDGG